jgi:hypothetical protein
MSYSYIRPVYIDRRHYVVTGEYPTYAVTDDQGRRHSVRWTGPNSVALKVPSCDCGEDNAPTHVCAHALAAYEHAVGEDHAARFPLVRTPPPKCTTPQRPGPPRLSEAELPGVRQKVADALTQGIPVVTGAWPVYTVTITGQVYAVVHDRHNRGCCSCDPQHAGWWQHSCVHIAIAYTYNFAIGLFAEGRASEEMEECARTGIVTEELLKFYYERSTRRKEKQANSKRPR